MLPYLKQFASRKVILLYPCFEVFYFSVFMTEKPSQLGQPFLKQFSLQSRLSHLFPKVKDSPQVCMKYNNKLDIEDV